MKIPIHDPKAFKQAHIRSQAEEMLNQVRKLEEAVQRMLIQARELQASLKNK